MLVYGFSFTADDVEDACKLYHQIFGWEIKYISPNHSELYIPKGILLIISPSKGKCPTFPGTLTIQVLPEEKEFIIGSKLWQSKFQKEYQDAKYESWLDPWGNRIWIYESLRI